MTRDVVVRVLGPIDVATASGAHPIGSRNSRALLGTLAVAAGHAVTVQQLEAAVWGDRPPPSAGNALQTYVSRLRRLVGHDRIVLEDHSYRLAVHRDEIDALRFEDLLTSATERRGQPTECVALCRDALALWRGRPFGDLADQEPFRLEAMRLEELRLAVIELALESELELGRHEIIVAELESAVHEYPYRERLWYLLVEALLRDDRRVEALRACTGLRDALNEVGLGAGDELRHLEHRILGTEPAP